MYYALLPSTSKHPKCFEHVDDLVCFPIKQQAYHYIAYVKIKLSFVGQLTPPLVYNEYIALTGINESILPMIT